MREQQQFCTKFKEILSYNSHRKSDKMQQCIRILFHIYTKLNTFWAACRPKRVELHVNTK